MREAEVPPRKKSAQAERGSRNEVSSEPFFVAGSLRKCISLLNGFFLVTKRRLNC